MKSANRAAGRQCILDQAQALFLAHGYHAVSIRDIVRACGLSNAALYYHFGNKQNLFVEVFKEYVAVLVQQVRDAGSVPGSCHQRVIRMAEAHAQSILKSKSELHTLIRDLMDCNEEGMRQLIREALDQIPSMFAAILEEGIGNGEIQTVDAHRVSVLLLGMIRSLTSHHRYDSVAETLAEDVEFAVNTLFEGISV